MTFVRFLAIWARFDFCYAYDCSTSIAIDFTVSVLPPDLNKQMSSVGFAIG